MQLGDPGEGLWGRGKHSWTAPHFGHRQAALPRGPRAHLGPREVPAGPRPAPRGRGKSQPRRCRQKWQGGECFLHLEPGAHPAVQK